MPCDMSVESPEEYVLYIRCLFEELSRHYMVHRLVGRYIVESMVLVGREWERVGEATALVLASMTSERVRVRDRIHMLLVGPPGTGKSDYMLALDEILGNASIYANAPYVSEVGLIGSSIGGVYRPGLLKEADGRLLLLDELDKMKPEDQKGLLQAMEQGEYEVVKANVNVRVKARVSVIAGANDVSRIQAPLLDRFDIIVNLRSPSRSEREKAVDRIIEKFIEEWHEDLWFLRIMMIEYTSWLSDWKPRMKNRRGVSEVIKHYIRSARLGNKSIRSLELSILRIARAIALANRRDIDPITVAEAIMLKDPYMPESLRLDLFSLASKYSV